MNMNDYRQMLDKVTPRDGLKDEIISQCAEKPRITHSFSKRKLAPIFAAAVIGCTSVTVAFADEIKSLFYKKDYLEMNISEVADPEVNEIGVYSASLKSWNEELAYNIFAGNKHVVNWEEVPSDINPGETYKYYELEDGSLYVVENGRIYYTTRSSYSYSLVAEQILFNGYTTNADSIDGFDKQEAKNTADDIVNKLGIDVYSSEIIAMDKDAMIAADISRESNEDTVDFKGEPISPWTEQQEGYIVSYTVNSDNLPVSVRNGSQVYMVISRNGLEYLSISWIYEENDVPDYSTTVCTAEEAANAFIEYYEINPDMSNYHQMLVENCKLVYIPIANEDNVSYQMKPFWEFDTKTIVTWGAIPEESVEAGSFDMYETICVDAETMDVYEEF